MVMQLYVHSYAYTVKCTVYGDTAGLNCIYLTLQ